MVSLLLQRRVSVTERADGSFQLEPSTHCPNDEQVPLGECFLSYENSSSQDFFFLKLFSPIFLLHCLFVSSM